MAKEFEPTKLNLRCPVPSDIEIAQEACVKPIAQIAEQASCTRCWVKCAPCQVCQHGLSFTMWIWI